MPNVVTLDMNTPSVQYLCKKDKRLARVIKMVGPIQYTSHDENAYSFLTHEIIEQMLSVKAGQKIYGRLEDLCDGMVTPERIAALNDDEIRGTGTSSSKVRCIRSVTEAVLCGDLDFNKIDMLSDEEVIFFPLKMALFYKHIVGYIKRTIVARKLLAKNAESGSLTHPLLPAFSIEHWMPD